MNDFFDVVVIGSGAGGATAACTLAENGLNVCLVEEGEHIKKEQFTNVPSQMIRKLYRNAGLTTIFGKPNIMYAEGKCVGGSTVINGGMCWPTPDRILEKWVNILSDSTLSPKNMESYFREVEKENYVKEQDPESLGEDNHLFFKTVTSLGWKIRANTRNQNHCAGTSNCVLGCPTGAKQSTLESYVPRFQKAGGSLLSQTKAERFTMAGQNATTLIATDLQKNEQKAIRAKAFILSAGSVYSPLILHQSNIRSQHLGKNLHLHPSLKVVGWYDQDLSMWKGVHQSHQITEFLHEGILLATGSVPASIVAIGLPGYGKEHGLAMEHFNNLMVIGGQIEDTNTGRIRVIMGRPLVTYFITQKDVQNAKILLSYAAKVHFAGGAKKVFLPFEGLPYIEKDDGLQKLADYTPKLHEIEMLSVHLMGTCRMSQNPSDGVVDSHGQVHGIQNLFVCDASVFPTAIGVNPMETIWALSKRTSHYLLEQKNRIFNLQ